ncbi:MAG: sodium:solute symporter [Thermaerobacter sp.]|nr:sodium:solute symporter [Thermaerobacter sp.]
MVNWTALIVFLVLFLFVAIMGFWAARWRSGDLSLLSEWGLAGRSFGTVITWFLLGGDLYTAYTFIAVPALVYAKGALGFFAVPYTIVVYPFVFLVMPRLWAVAKKHNYITPSDFVKGRFGSRGLALAIAITGILATMPYIALQLVGIQYVLAAMGITGSGLMNDLPLIIAFVILAAYTYTSGLRAPALTAVVKDILIYLTIIVALIVIPARLGGFGAIFQAASQQLPGHTPPGSLILSPSLFAAYGTLAFGSALALFLYPHALTGVFSSNGPKTIKRNAALLPIYSLLLGFIALLGYMALAAHVNVASPNAAVPALFLKMFPSWFAGVAFAAIAIGALVPASIMSIAAANLFSRNIWREYVNPNMTDKQESKTAKVTSLVVKLGALAFIIFIPATFSIQLQLLGGIWILQTLPSIVIGLYTRWMHRTGLLIGWFVGMVFGTFMAATTGFSSSVFAVGGVAGYAGIWALLANLVVVVVLTWVLRASRVPEGNDATAPTDYALVEETSAAM